MAVAEVSNRSKSRVTYNDQVVHVLQGDQVPFSDDILVLVASPSYAYKSPIHSRVGENNVAADGIGIVVDDLLSDSAWPFKIFCTQDIRDACRPAMYGSTML